MIFRQCDIDLSSFQTLFIQPKGNTKFRRETLLSRWNKVRIDISILPSHLNKYHIIQMLIPITSQQFMLTSLARLSVLRNGGQTSRRSKYQLPLKTSIILFTLKIVKLIFIAMSLLFNSSTIVAECPRITEFFSKRRNTVLRSLVIIKLRPQSVDRTRRLFHFQHLLLCSKLRLITFKVFN